MTTPKEQAWMEAFELYQSRQTEENRRALLLATSHYMISGMTRSRLGPVLGCMWVVAQAENSRFLRCVVRIMTGYYRQIVYRHFPLWNDFEMTRWLLTHSDEAMLAIHQQIHSYSKDDMVRTSGHWMIRSVMCQDPVFAEHWRRLFSACPDACINDCATAINNLPPDVRERAKSVFGGFA